MRNKIHCSLGTGLSFFLMQLWQPAQAQVTDLADAPLSVNKTVKANVMFTLDNSSSMARIYLPDSVIDGTSIKQTRDYETKNCYKNSFFNGVFYDPNISYKPGMKADGTAYPDAVFTRAYVDGYDSIRSYKKSGNGNTLNTPLDLSREFQVYLGEDFGSGLYEQSGPAYYYRYTGTTPAIPVAQTCYDDANYTKVVVGPSEQQNFANWFSYYRTRILAMKSAVSLAFAGVGEGVRIGFSTINNPSGPNNNGRDFIAIDDFKSCAIAGTCQKSTWYRTLFSINPTQTTPLGEAIRKVGEYYKTGKMPGVTPPTADPIQVSCQQNYQIVATDGYWVNLPSVPVGNNDKIVPALPEPISLDPIAGVALTTGQPFPPIFREGATATSDNLADITIKYWITDLRPNMNNNVPASNSDPATWQHMTTFGIALGVPGLLPNDDTTYNQLKAGTLQWPEPVPNTPTASDDFWHATINGHGAYFNTKKPDDLTQALNDILNSIATSSEGSSAALAVSNPNVSSSDNTSFSSSYNTGSWTGDLVAYPINISTGRIEITNPVWSSSAQAQLDARLWSSRYIATYSGATGIPFDTTTVGLSTTQLARLNSAVSPANDAAMMVDFLRGDRGQEMTSNGKYRARAHVLGDIINAEPVYVTAPSARYTDNGYAAFKTSSSSRQKMVYQGANDGMLHAFNASTGAEMWAYIPGLLIAAPLDTSANSSATTSSLVNLSKNRAMGFEHRYYVDATPVQADIDENNTLSRPTGVGPSWKSLLVGGLNKGGRGYYALDVTDPTAASDTDVANKVKWEFPNDQTDATVKSNIGYSYGKPVSVKTKAAGWVVLVTSGYNNGTPGDGLGHLFVLNAKTGALIKDIITSGGSSTQPSGLAQISAYVENDQVDKTTDYVYGGDLLGNLWRFNLSGNDTTSWEVTLLATLVDDSRNPQPITSAPELGKNASGKRMVFVGTGAYLGRSDTPGAGANPHATQQQTLYGLIDDSQTEITPLRSSLQQQTLSLGSNNSTTTATATNTALDATKKGWYVDLPHANERANTDPVFAFGAVTFTTNIPDTNSGTSATNSADDGCVARGGGSSWIYFLDFQTGGRLENTSNDSSGAYLGGFLSSRPVLVRLPDGKVVAETIGSNATKITTPAPFKATPTAPRRIVWREVIDH